MEIDKANQLRSSQRKRDGWVRGYEENVSISLGSNQTIKKNQVIFLIVSQKELKSKRKEEIEGNWKG